MNKQNTNWRNNGNHQAKKGKTIAKKYSSCKSNNNKNCKYTTYNTACMNEQIEQFRVDMLQ